MNLQTKITIHMVLIVNVTRIVTSIYKILKVKMIAYLSTLINDRYKENIFFFFLIE
jgi:hypothetical protein